MNAELDAELRRLFREDRGDCERVITDAIRAEVLPALAIAKKALAWRRATHMFETAGGLSPREYRMIRKQRSQAIVDALNDLFPLLDARLAAQEASDADRV